MKRYLIAISAMLATLTAAATGTDSIGDILRQIAANNLTLKAQAHESEADVLKDLKKSARRGSAFGNRKHSAYGSSRRS